MDAGLSIFILIVLPIYFLPSIIALLRYHPQTVPIIIINLFLGATGIGWVVALAWSFMQWPKPPASA